MIDPFKFAYHNQLVALLAMKSDRESEDKNIHFQRHLKQQAFEPHANFHPAKPKKHHDVAF